MTATLKTAFRGGDSEERPGWWIGFGYDKAVIERLKRDVPHDQRVWDQAAALWWVSRRYEHVLLEIFGGSFNVHLNAVQLL